MNLMGMGNCSLRMAVTMWVLLLMVLPTGKDGLSSAVAVTMRGR